MTLSSNKYFAVSRNKY